MKIVKKIIDSKGEGKVVLKPTTNEDLWEAYNVISPGDVITSVTIRRIQRQTVGGGQDSERKPMKLSLKVTQVDYDPGASRLRVAGTNLHETQWVKFNQFHTFELQPFFEFTVWKHHWNNVSLNRILAATDESRGATTAIVVLEEGSALICLVSDSLTLVKAKVEKVIPRKSPLGMSKRQTAIEKFLSNVYQSMVNAIDLEAVKAIVIGSPGFIKEDLLKMITTEGSKDSSKGWGNAKAKILLETTSSGSMAAVSELLQLPSVQRHMGDSKAAVETAELEKFLQAIFMESDRVCYGIKHVQAAIDMGAVEKLLISDNIFRSNNLSERKRAVALTEAVEASSGVVRVFSAEHPAGRQVAQFGGLAATLRFPVDLEEEEVEAEDDAPADGAESDWATGDELPY
ncbi:Translation release factor pelota [Carpediemonas membranifera]|uniref:Protein pelota homolog n=1 Tax=Carpediemonas membranifera TaxID=201153 RepID=A0A8J6BBF1_9EUKA|nr:Translation release factor pelota [Carpediemonas membranifera]|eukprot:KAG9397244.1 Translation release factor pelota [Carpediemonas membranifera]